MPQVGPTWGCEIFCESPVRPHPPPCAPFCTYSDVMCLVTRMTSAVASRGERAVLRGGMVGKIGVRSKELRSHQANSTIFQKGRREQD